MADPLLCVRDLRLSFGGVVALGGVSFDVPAGAKLAIIGPNGAGKTTLFNCISGIHRCASGDILLAGESLLHLPAHGIAARGVGRTFQNLALFSSMNARDTVMVGGYCRGTTGFLQNALQLGSARREERLLRARVEDLLSLLGLDALAEVRVARLPAGLQRRVEIARALAGQPRLLMLDEPASGLARDEVEALTALLESVRRQFDITVLVIEHHIDLVMCFADRIVALDFGSTIAEGSPAEIRANADVIRAYLGVTA